ncbi:MAG TPA: nicotinate-nucleotide adenylyltransferase [Longimicrobiales bacterium]|nr:nicotinate-nucleotide adenylyltransferase [Longimicrobiales bacterium]
MTGPPQGRARIGLFGGTFDPPHRGHVVVASDVADALDLDCLLWIPARRSPHKPPGSGSPPEVRLEMVRAAAEGDPRFRVETLELERDEPSYTVDTVRELRARYPDAELFLVLGADQLRAFPSWREPERIVEDVRLAVMDRGGDSAREVARGVPGGDRAVFVPVRRVDVSSTAVRARVREGRDISALVPERVREIIAREGLYSTG